MKQIYCFLLVVTAIVATVTSIDLPIQSCPVLFMNNKGGFSKEPWEMYPRPLQSDQKVNVTKMVATALGTLPEQHMIQALNVQWTVPGPPFLYQTDTASVAFVSSLRGPATYWNHQQRILSVVLFWDWHKQSWAMYSQYCENSPGTPIVSDRILYVNQNDIVEHEIVHQGRDWFITGRILSPALTTHEEILLKNPLYDYSWLDHHLTTRTLYSSSSVTLHVRQPEGAITYAIWALLDMEVYNMNNCYDLPFNNNRVDATHIEILSGVSPNDGPWSWSLAADHDLCQLNTTLIPWGDIHHVCFHYHYQ
jgi:hypothetical protein